MAARRAIAATVCALALWAGPAWIAADEDGEGIDWRTNLEAAHAEAKRSGKPLMIVFR